MKYLLLAAVGLCLAAPRVILARPQVCYSINECGTLAWGVEGGCLVWHSDIDPSRTMLIDPNLGYAPPARLWVQGMACDCFSYCMEGDLCLQGPYAIGPCPVVSAHRLTWGRVKILYR